VKERELRKLKFQQLLSENTPTGADYKQRSSRLSEGRKSTARIPRIDIEEAEEEDSSGDQQKKPESAKLKTVSKERLGGSQSPVKEVDEEERKSTPIESARMEGDESVSEGRRETDANPFEPSKEDITIVEPQRTGRRRQEEAGFGIIQGTLHELEENFLMDDFDVDDLLECEDIE